ncbi:helix-turn-helix transcriptional regulator [Pseudomonas sp. MF5691]|uniref:helix-turn-helix domain-containing protein n=1 Tax=Pseudomonas sp. MF5691 TaxID=2797526 RepID=UPI0018E8926F|nr:helix-turn-helix transcriptional regulator [Pseudomonas sp. MF5691]MBJ2293265.1 helix-turn-helix transcriptional regulator [Pseudomonas sp. MF5691]
MISPTRKFIGARIKALRKAKGITQAVLAEALECENATISRYERGEYVPDSEQLLKIAKLLGASPMDILPTDDDVSRERLLELRATLQDLIFTIDNPSFLTKLIELAKTTNKKNS